MNRWSQRSTYAEELIELNEFLTTGSFEFHHMRYLINTYLEQHPPIHSMEKMKAAFLKKAKQLAPILLQGPPWKGTLIPDGCEEWIQIQCNAARQDAARTYCENIRYITHDEFVQKLHTVYQALPRTKHTYFMVEGEKSSEYCALILYALDPSIADHIFYRPMWEVSLENTNGNDDDQTYDYIGRLLTCLLKAPEGEDVHLIYMDDMSYSAGQALNQQSSLLVELFQTITTAFEPENRMRPTSVFTLSAVKQFMDAIGLTIHNAYAYLTEHARQILTGEREYQPYGPETVIPLFLQPTLHVGEVIPSLRAAVGEEMFRKMGAYFGYPAEYDEEHIAPDCIVYFDHKIADKVSMMGLPLVTGRAAPGAKNRNQYMANTEETANTRLPNWILQQLNNGTGACAAASAPIITRCAPTTRISSSNFPVNYPSVRCPLPWYKHMNSETGAIRAPTVNTVNGEMPYTNVYSRVPLHGGHKTQRRKRRRVRNKTGRRR